MPAQQARRLVDRTDERRRAVTRALDKQRQAELGQYFTPAAVASFMASLPRCNGRTLRILDPGAGVGSLTASIVARIISEHPGTSISITVCEVDETLHAHLQETLDDCAHTAAEFDSRVEVNLVREDFIEWASNPASLFGHTEQEFDLVVMNPPYRKLGRGSWERKLAQQLTTDVPNIYAAFLALAVHLLAPEGQLVAITPRSFTNGPYFRSFRRYFLKRVQMDHVHIFGARNKIFAETPVLQENIIFSVTRSAALERSSVTLSTSASHEDEPDRQVVRYDEIVRPDDVEAFIHLSMKEDGKQFAARLASLSCTLSDLNLQVSTGRVVDFRSREHLRRNPMPGTVPLIYPLHMHDSLIRWPLIGAKKSNAIALNGETEKLTFPSGFYVVVKRLSSKEERRRVVAALFDPREVASDRIGFENHVNVFHHEGGGFSGEVARGLCLWLNSSVLDWSIRGFSGHTQVNATDLRSLHYPSIRELSAIGLFWEPDVWLDQSKIDEIVEGHMV